VQKTRPLQYDATEEQVTAALEALASVGRVNVALSTGVSSSGVNNRMWSVTFLSNIGNLPSLVPIKDLLVGESASLTVAEVTAGTEPSFDQGTVGVNVMPLGFKDIEPLPEIQTIIVTSGAEDLDGDFKIGYRGEVTAAIPWNAEASFVKARLEDLSKIREVIVTAEDIAQSNPLPYARFGRKWTVTFVSEPGNVPSLLVTTNNGATYTVEAAGGVAGGSYGLAGTTPRVVVQETRRGSLPRDFVFEGPLAATPLYVRVFAASAGGRSPFVLAGNSATPGKRAPGAPTAVFVSVLGANKLGVSWDTPAYDGGDAITKYTR
jgi:hypothetical protein